MDYDIAIVGGGLVGLALARALAATSHRIVLIEQGPIDVTTPKSIDRPLTLAPSSQYCLNQLGVWPTIEDAVIPIRTIHVSRQYLPIHTLLTASAFQRQALGYVIPAGVLQQVLQHAAHEQANLTVLSSCHIQSIDVKQDHSQLIYQSSKGIQQLRVSLVVAADGSQSTVRTQLRIPVQQYDDQHWAMVGTLQLQRSHRYVAYERFLKHSILALLPYAKQRMGLVWCMTKSQWQKIEALDSTAVLTQLQKSLGYRLGRVLAVEGIQAWPLTAIHAQSCIGPRAVLIGNAAHTLYPVAAQGLNLGLRDVLVLADQLKQWSASADVVPLLNRYQQLRAPDHQQIRRLITSLLRLYGRPFPMQRMIQCGAMILFDQVDYCRQRLGRCAMGLAHLPI